MSAKLKVPRAVVKNPILLWLMIHGGDPGPEDDGPVGPHHNLTQVLTIHELAGQIADASLRKSIQNLTGKAIGNLSQKMVNG